MSRPIRRWTRRSSSLKAAGADIFYNVTTPKFAAQAIKKAAEIGWKPVHLLNSVSSSVGAVIKPAGIENAQGIFTALYGKDPTDPIWNDDPGRKEWIAFMDKYYPDGDKSSSFTAYGYSVARTMVQVLKQSGDDLTRANVMKQAASLKDFDTGMSLPGIKINTSATDYYPIEHMQMGKFEGESFKPFGPILQGEVGSF